MDGNNLFEEGDEFSCRPAWRLPRVIVGALGTSVPRIYESVRAGQSNREAGVHHRVDRCSSTKESAGCHEGCATSKRGRWVARVEVVCLDGWVHVSGEHQRMRDFRHVGIVRAGLDNEDRHGRIRLSETACDDTSRSTSWDHRSIP
jgi:hypothetical protein